MKKMIPLFLLLLFLSGCAGSVETTPAQDTSLATPSQTTISTPSATPSQTMTPLPTQSPTPVESTVPPTQKLPKWHYDLTRNGVYRTDQNTGDVIKINDSEYATGIIITEDWVYYRDDNSHLYRMDNENRKELLVSEKCWPLRLSDDALYYLSSSGINRMNLDGSGKEHLFQCDYSGIEMTDIYIFYTLNTPESDESNKLPGAEDGPWYLGELHRVGLDGEGDVKVADIITELSVYENVVYFTDDDTNFYSLNPETLEKTKIDNVCMVEDSHFASGYLFFMTHTDRCFYRMSLIDGTLTKLSGGWPHCHGILDGYVYIDVSAGESEEDIGLFRVKIDSVELEKVAGW